MTVGAGRRGTARRRRRHGTRPSTLERFDTALEDAWATLLDED